MPQYPHRPPRQDVARPALVILENGDQLPCLIRNVSRRGACITMINADLFVDSFELKDKFLLEQWGAEVRWRYPNRVGLQLDGQPPTFAIASDRSFGKRG